MGKAPWGKKKKLVVWSLVFVLSIAGMVYRPFTENQAQRIVHWGPNDVAYDADWNVIGRYPLGTPLDDPRDEIIVVGFFGILFLVAYYNLLGVFIREWYMRVTVGLSLIAVGGVVWIFLQLTIFW